MCGLTGKDETAAKKKIDSTEEPCQTGAISHTKSRSEAKTFRAFYHPRPRLGVNVKKKK